VSGTYELAVLSKTPCGEDVITIRFERPDGFTFLPGQWLRLTLKTEQGEETKTFTNSSARGDDWLELTTRLSGSSFKQALAEVQAGDLVTIQGPGGRLSLPDGTDRVAFVVGGVGITPARSILRDAAQRNTTFTDALVIYGNRDQTCTPYLEELQGLVHLGVRVVPVYERAGRDWKGDTGFITAEIIRRHVDPSDGRPFFVAGPPIMVEAINTVLDELGVAVDRRRIEWFGAPRL